MNSKEVMDLKQALDNKKREKEQVTGALKQIESRMEEKGFKNIKAIEQAINKDEELLTKLETSIQEKIDELKKLLNAMDS